MTALNVVGALIGFFMYPYVVRVTGREAFGVYPYAVAWIIYFQFIINFGLDTPAAKAIVEHATDKTEKEKILSSVFTAKLLLFVVATLLFTILMFIVPDMQMHSKVFAATYIQTIVNILFPDWYFQGMRNMRIVTYINLACRIMAVPLILLLVTNSSHVWVYAAIVSATSILGSIAASLYIIIHDGLRIHLVPIRTLKTLFSDGVPFVMTQIAGVLQDGLLTIIIRHFFGYADVALFDIAKKIISIPRMFTQSINRALFPEIVTNPSPVRVRRVLFYERIIGIIVSIMVIALAYPIVLLMFGIDNINAYPLSAIHSLSIYTWLVAGAYLQFVFIPHHRYYYISINQVVSLISCMIFIALSLLIWRNIMMIAIALSLSGFCEILFCRYATRKNKLL